MIQDNSIREQMFDRNEQLQIILNNTHSMLIENSNLVEQLNENVIGKTTKSNLQSKHINHMKDEGRNQAINQFGKVLEKQTKEWGREYQNV